MTKLSSICTLFTDGDWIESKDQSDSGIRLIQTGNIGEGCFLEKAGKEKYVSEETFDRLKCEEVFPGDILISRLPEPVGRACIVPEKTERMITAVDCSICRVNEKLIDKEYLCYFLQSRSYYQQLNNNVAGTTRKRISRKNLGDVEIDIPSFEIQKHVVEALNKITTIIQGRKQELQEFDNLIKSRFVEMFGDLVLGDKFSDVKQKIGDIAYVTKLAGFEFTKFIQYKERGDIIMLRGLNCKKGHLVLDDIKWIDRETSDLLPRSKLYYGDILMTYAGTIGDVAMVDEDDKYHLAPNVAKITLQDKKMCNPVFLIHLFMYSHDYIMTFASQVAQASINMEKIRSFEYYFPPVVLQNEFEQFVTQVDKLKFEVQKSLDETQTLMDSLMQQYFG
ncbi:MAG: restriction endonuclease subunit S [Tyzzerella sp.]|nr:restriction endonuclease subunit S [Tyzzerella sp.]